MTDHSERWTAYQARRERYRLSLYTTTETGAAAPSCTACLGAFIYNPADDRVILKSWTTWESPTRADALKRAEEITGPFENYEWERSEALEEKKRP